ncbi:MAG TPA: hypothetical protein PLV92_21055, partial [Pirellulaceae bacterium]|nr:hypothetical protein [Pirellulaceae bacterium]
RLLLPETHRWFNFGGTLGQVNDAGDYEASFLEYQTKRIMRLSDVLRSDANGSLMKMRASNNLKQLADVVAAQQSQGDNPAYRFNDSFVKNNAQLNSVVDQARQQVEAEWKTQQDQGGAVEQDNRDRLQQRFDEQSNQRARNVVNQLGANFYAAPASPPAEAAAGGGEAFNANWFATNGLVRGVDVGRVNMGDQSRKSGVASGKDFDAKGGKGVQAGQGQEEIVKGLQKNLEENLQTRNSNPALRSKAKRSGDGEEAELQKRYQQRLEVQQEQAQSQAQILNPSLQNGRLPQMNDGGQFGGRAGNRAGGGMGGGAVGGMANGLPQQPSFQPPMPAKPQSTSPRGTTSGPVQNDVSGRNVVPFGERAGEKAVQDAEDKPVDAVEALDPYLTSLTVELPGRGVEFLFKTPRGDLEITATAVAEPLVQRLLRLVVVLIVVLGPGLAAWLLRHRFLRRIS